MNTNKTKTFQVTTVETFTIDQDDNVLKYYKDCNSYVYCGKLAGRTIEQFVYDLSNDEAIDTTNQQIKTIA